MCAYMFVLSSIWTLSVCQLKCSIIHKQNQQISCTVVKSIFIGSMLRSDNLWCVHTVQFYDNRNFYVFIRKRIQLDSFFSHTKKKCKKIFDYYCNGGRFVSQSPCALKLFEWQFRFVINQNRHWSVSASVSFVRFFIFHPPFGSIYSNFSSFSTICAKSKHPIRISHGDIANNLVQ